MDYPSLVAANLACRGRRSFDPTAEDEYYQRSMLTVAPVSTLRSIGHILMYAVWTAHRQPAPI
jgi:hypothetical protein